ncbi:Ketopantoate reductase PanE/ApbA C terminal [Sphingomonas guangdongensis]|uniref:Ketopantoate reductase PanE/ApbA C terminal n=2 Tax=Sphingomonas guangdongensis TaxID=1141890 RepID=A0A285QC39_9SPHN|nr:Ketopantoate reductase PanE/ApbA C terminal [Sphingomonas guangdongensis]
MPQDHRRGRPLEADALLHLPLAFARAAGVAAPTLTTLAALVSAALEQVVVDLVERGAKVA